MAAHMAPSKVKYNFVEEVERLDYYVPGGNQQWYGNMHRDRVKRFDEYIRQPLEKHGLDLFPAEEEVASHGIMKMMEVS